MPTLFEKKWPTITLSPISIANSVVTVSSTAGLHPKQVVSLIKLGTESKQYEIKRVICPNRLYLGPIGSPLTAYLNPTQFDGGTLCAEEQNRNPIEMQAVLRACYAEEPTIALRSTIVDRCGEHIDSIIDSVGNRRLAVDSSFNIGHLEVNIEHPNSFLMHNIVGIGGGTEQSLVMPANLMRFLIRVRDGSANLNLAFAETESSTNFIKVYRGTYFSSGDVDNPSSLPVPGTPMKLYFQVDKPGVIVEVLLWTRI